MIRLLVALGATFVTLVSLNFDQAPLRAQAGSQVLLSRGRTEPVLAVDPAHPQTMVVGSNTNYDVSVGGTYPVEVFSSTDGGVHFSSSPMPVLAPFTTGADPDVQIDGNGTVFYSYLGEAATYCANGPSAVLVTHSTNGGRTFKSLVPVDRNPNDDKPWMAVQTVPGRSSHLFLTWTRWLQHSGDIWYSRSFDGGAHFIHPWRLYTSSQDNAGAEPVIGPNRRVYVVWASFADAGSHRPVTTSVYIRTSSDDGVHFGPAHRIAGPFWGVPHMSQPASLRNITFPSVAAGSDGSVVAAWPQVRRDFGGGRTQDDILVSRSTDQGRSWSAPMRVNDATSGDRFMPVVTPLPGNRFAVAFYDRRAGPNTLRVYAATVAFNHGLQVSGNARVDTGNSPVSDIYYLAPGSTCFTPGRFFGDYIGLRACGGSLCAVWSDTSLQNANETDLWFRRLAVPAMTGHRTTQSVRPANASGP